MRTPASGIRPWLLLLMLMASLVPGAAEAEPTYPIGVELSLPTVLTQAWPSGEADRVSRRATQKFLEALKSEHPHWIFTDQGNNRSVLSLQVLEVADEVRLALELKLGATSRAVAEHVWFKPGYFATYGRPSPNDAERSFETTLREFLKRARLTLLQTLRETVPIAGDPSAIDVAERSVTLPLSRARYQHLQASSFVLRCNPSRDVNSEARNEWSSYDSSIPEGLKIRITEEMSAPELRSLQPRFVFLREYVPPTPWGRPAIPGDGT